MSIVFVASQSKFMFLTSFPKQDSYNHFEWNDTKF